MCFGSLTAEAATFTVTNTNDSGAGSLRQAILNANANAGADLITFNIPAAGVQTISVLSELPAITDPVTIDGYSQPGASANTLASGDNAILLIELSGANAKGANGLLITGGGSTIKGLVINTFQSFGTSFVSGITLSGKGGNVIAGNFIGTNSSGSAPIGTSKPANSTGLTIDGISNNTIGGTAPAARNLISGNNLEGIHMIHPGATGNIVQGNFIGTDRTGTVAVGNNRPGVYVDGIGGAATGTIIGGTAPGAGNLISGNGNEGIKLWPNSTGVLIQGNLIGTDITGKLGIGNNGAGIYVTTGVGGTIIGGTTVAARNVISANFGGGIEVDQSTQGTVIQGNYIGADITGTAAIPNDYGIFAVGANLTVGGTTAGAGNIISFNNKVGVLISGPPTSTGNLIEGNSIYSNGALGIDLGPAGVTPNDPGDSDTGANNLQNFPVISSALLSGGTTTVSGALNSTAGTQFRVEFFDSQSCDPSTFGQGQVFIGSANVTTDGSGNATLNQTFSGPGVGEFITATATDPSGNTSEFSQCRQVSVPGTSVTLQFSAANYSVNENGGTATFTVTRSGGNTGAVSVHYASFDGTATAGSDYTAVSGTLNWADGDAGSKTVSVPILNDSLNEIDETVNLVLTNPGGGAALGNLAAAVLTIIDDDPKPSLSISDVTKAEGDSGTTDFTFTLTLSTASGQNVFADYTTADGTAHATADYVSLSGTIGIAAGTTSRDITVRVVGDTQIEPNETFFVNLSNPVGATIAKAQGVGTIINDDSIVPATLGFSQASYSIQENLGALTVIVTRSGDTTGACSVDYATVDGTATQKSDFEYAAGSLKFAAGETSKTFQVLVNDDVYVEGNETFSLVLNNPAGAVIGSQGTAPATIVDNVPESITNPIDDAQSFVYMQYHDFLNREPDATGLAFWTNQITVCGTNQTCIDSARANVSAAFYLSIEFQQTGYLLYLIQKESYATMPKYNAFMRDLQEVSRGVIVNSPGWQQKLADNQQQFATAWANRPEFKAVYNGMSNTDFVNALYANAGVVATQADRDTLVSRLDTANETRSAALLDVASNAAFRQSEMNGAFVLMEYFGYLR
ncbi:MAG TPA: Calx-beta domain-containing protein, partial [Pyrinomonadaceae bacterium]|nr:Calx-beta domain-containing protein [Pyrinomonadaceae bacterium]